MASLPLWRPRTRGDCEGLPRPCPFVGCRYNTFLDVDVRGKIRVAPRRRRLGPLGAPAETSCSLDVAHAASSNRHETAEAMGLGYEAVRQIEVEAIAELRRRDDGTLRVLLGLWSDALGREQVSADALGDDDRDANEDDVSHAGALSRAEAEAAELEAWSARAAAYVLAGIPVRVAWTLADEERSEAMAKMVKTTKNKAIAADVVKNGALRHQLDEEPLGKAFTGKHPVPIDAVRRDKVSDELVDVLGQIDVVNEERAAEIGKFNASLKTLRQKQHDLAEAHRTSTEKRDVTCQAYLTRQGEVVTRRLDTNEIVERRTAKAEELQDEIPGSRQKVAHKPLIDMAAPTDAP